MSLPSTAATVSTPNNKRLQRTSNPTPPEREDSKKSRRNNSSSSKKNMEKGKLDDIIQSSISQTVKISEDDIKKNCRGRQTVHTRRHTTNDRFKNSASDREN